jgi:hypothetical protein
MNAVMRKTSCLLAMPLSYRPEQEKSDSKLTHYPFLTFFDTRLGVG